MTTMNLTSGFRRTNACFRGPTKSGNNAASQYTSKQASTLLDVSYSLDIIRNKKIRWDGKSRSAKSSFLPYFLDLFRLQKHTFCTPELISNNV